MDHVVTLMPLACNGSAVAHRFQHFGESNFGLLKAVGVRGRCWVCIYDIRGFPIAVGTVPLTRQPELVSKRVR